MLEEVFTNQSHKGQSKQISTITGIAGLRRKDEREDRQFIQGMEKLIDAMQGEKYSLLLIADPVQQAQIEQIRRGYESLYSELSPWAGHDLNFGENESQSVSDTISEGTSESISDTLSFTKGTSKSETKGSSDTLSVHAGGGVSVGVSAGFKPVASANVSKNFYMGVGYARGWNRSKTEGTNESEGKSKAITEGQTYGTSQQKSKSDSQNWGQSRNIQLKFENKTVKTLLEKINAQLKRLDTSADTGMWNCSVYCLADTAPVSKIVASAYQALLRGENSSIETGNITVWPASKIKELKPWLTKMHHPYLKMDDNLEITPTSFISSAELAIHAVIPQTRVGGLPVLKLATFGRDSDEPGCTERGPGCPAWPDLPYG